MLRAVLAASLLLVAACSAGPGTTVPPTASGPTATSAPASAAASVEPTVEPRTVEPGTAQPSPTPEPSPTTDASASPPVDLAVSIGPNGNFVGYQGHTLYTFDNDRPGVSNCEGDCLFNWPPLLVAAADDIPLGEGLDPADFATITRADGALQVTYEGRPLYFYTEDLIPGDAMGDGIGGVWHLISGAAPASPADGAVDY